MTNQLHQPLLKWPGGKTKLMPSIRERFPRDESLRWVEPFIGSGSVFLNMFVSHGILADSNPDLINFYMSVQSRKSHLVEQIKELSGKTYSEPDYYQLRDNFNSNDEPVSRAAQFYALNKLGFNGLCRYSLKSRKYSVPWGKRSCFTFSPSRIDYLCFRLSGIELLTTGFEVTLADAGAGDQIYCDPPYDKLNNGSFVSYDGTQFDKLAHTLLADMLVNAHRKGATVAISNSKTPFTMQLYEDRGFAIHELSAYRSIGGKGSSRSKAIELLAVLG